MKLLFWFSFLMIFYTYFGYPALLFLISKLKNNTLENHTTSQEIPFVSFIITAYNEEQQIKEKIEATLGLDYPKKKLEIIIASDCSSDNTDDIVRSFEYQGVKLIRSPERMGKENAQGLAVVRSKYDILIFSDVATILETDGILKIVRNFSNPLIGCVSSEDKFLESDGSISGEGAYVKYEMLLRRLESKVNTLVGLSGSFFAARRSVCNDWAKDLQSDFNTLLNSIKKGLIGISDPESIGYYKNISDEKEEFNRKVRTVLRGLSVFSKSISVLNPFKYGLFSWQIFSHKLCRWVVPFLLILNFISNGILILNSVFYFFVFILQLVFYGMALLYHSQVFQGKLSGISVIKIPYYFSIVNLSILTAWFKLFKGERSIFWEPSKR